MIPVAAYIAGMVDADGHVSSATVPNGRRLEIVVTNTYVPMMLWLGEQTGVKVSPYMRNEKCEEACIKSHVHMRKDVYRWVVRGQRALIVGRGIYPYMIEKKTRLLGQIKLERARDKIRWKAQIQAEMYERGWLSEV